MVAVFKYMKGCCKENQSNNISWDWEVVVGTNCSERTSDIGKTVFQVSLMPAFRDCLSKVGVSVPGDYGLSAMM